MAGTFLLPFSLRGESWKWDGEHRPSCQAHSAAHILAAGLPLISASLSQAHYPPRPSVGGNFQSGDGLFQEGAPEKQALRHLCWRGGVRHQECSTDTTVWAEPRPKGRGDSSQEGARSLQAFALKGILIKSSQGTSLSRDCQALSILFLKKEPEISWMPEV